MCWGVEYHIQSRTNEIDYLAAQRGFAAGSSLSYYSGRADV